jgi:hypothetical protein
MAQNIDDDYHLLAKMMAVIYIVKTEGVFFGEKSGTEGGEQAGNR